MSKAFYADAVEALRGFLPRAHRDFHAHVHGRGMKIWYSSWHEHYEVQELSRSVLRAAGITDFTTAIEIGFHAEHPKPVDNDAVLEIIGGVRLGKESVAGPFVGRAEQRNRWRRVSELWDGEGVEEDGTAFEAADRLADYVKAIQPRIARTPEGSCACWKPR